MELCAQEVFDFFQEVEVHLTPTTAPRLMTVEAVPGNFPQPLVMDPGRWSVSFENNQNFFLVCIVTQEQNIVPCLCYVSYLFVKMSSGRNFTVLVLSRLLWIERETDKW